MILEEAGIPVEAQAPAAGGEASPADSSVPESVTWPEVAGHLARMIANGEEYTSDRKLCEDIGCHHGTLKKAFERLPMLQVWKDKAAVARNKNKTKPATFQLSDAMADSRPDEKATEPSEHLPDDDIDATLRRLIKEAPDEESRKRLQEVIDQSDDDGRRKLAEAYTEFPEYKEGISGARGG